MLCLNIKDSKIIIIYNRPVKIAEILRLKIICRIKLDIKQIAALVKCILLSFSSIIFYANLLKSTEFEEILQQEQEEYAKLKQQNDATNLGVDSTGDSNTELINNLPELKCS